MEDIIPCPVKDREVFQRVWQRVMGDREMADSPVQPVSPDWEGDLSCACLDALSQPQGEGVPPECRRREEQTRPGQMAPPSQGWEEPMRPEMPTEPEMPMEPEPSLREPAEEAPSREPAENTAPDQGLPPADGPDRGNDLPRLWEEPQPADDRTARMRRHVMDALEGWQFYRHLARRARGTDARTLNGMAADQHKHARKLSAAYFLLTGLRYWPTETLGAPAIPSYWGALRQRYQAEQRQENAYRLASDDWEDPDILALYAALIEGCQRRSQQLRSLLEQSNT